MQAQLHDLEREGCVAVLSLDEFTLNVVLETTSHCEVSQTMNSRGIHGEVRGTYA
jgi:hypothetical protein